MGDQHFITTCPMYIYIDIYTDIRIDDRIKPSHEILKSCIYT